jgi:ribosomal-protein-serine acetyltransferase
MAEPIMLDVPDEMETDRLLMRVPRAGDGARMNVAVRESIAEVGRWMPWAVPTPEPEATEKWCREAAAKFLAREQFHFSLYLKGTDTFLGNCGIHRIIWDVPLFELGFWLHTSHCGKGYMTEAVRQLERFAFEQLGANRIEIRCDHKNDRSARVAERLGFQLDAVLRGDARGTDKVLRDTRIYSKVWADLGKNGR